MAAQHGTIRALMPWEWNPTLKVLLQQLITSWTLTNDGKVAASQGFY